MNNIHPKAIVDAMLHVCLMRDDAGHGDWCELFKAQGGWIPEIIRGKTAEGHATQIAAMTFDEADYLCLVSRNPQAQGLKLGQLLQLPEQLEPHEIQVALYALASCWHITTAPCAVQTGVAASSTRSCCWLAAVVMAILPTMPPIMGWDRSCASCACPPVRSSGIPKRLTSLPCSLLPRNSRRIAKMRLDLTRPSPRWMASLPTAAQTATVANTASFT